MSASSNQIHTIEAVIVDAKTGLGIDNASFLGWTIHESPAQTGNKGIYFISGPARLFMRGSNYSIVCAASGYETQTALWSGQARVTFRLNPAQVVSGPAPPALKVVPDFSSIPQVRLTIQVRLAQNAALTALTINWGDGDSSSFPTGNPLVYHLTTISHSYRYAGKFSVLVTATDSNNLTSSVALTITVPNHLDLFVAGVHGAVQTVSWITDKPWSSWSQLSGLPVRPGFPVEAASRTIGSLELFVVGQDGNVWTTAMVQGEDWSRWYQVGADFPGALPGSGVAAVPRILYNVAHWDLFAAGVDGSIYTASWASGSPWSSWRPIKGITVGVGTTISAVARSPSNLDVFIIGEDGKAWSSWTATGQPWSQWYEPGTGFPGAQPGSRVAPVSRIINGDPHWDLFVVGNDGNVHNTWWDLGSTWSAWSQVQGITVPVGTPISAASRSTLDLDIFLVGQDGMVWSSWTVTGQPWSQWYEPGTGFPGAQPKSNVAVTTRGEAHWDLAVAGKDGGVYTANWDLGSPWSPWSRIQGNTVPPGAHITTVSR